MIGPWVERALAVIFATVGVVVWALGVAVSEPAAHARYLSYGDPDNSQLVTAWSWCKDVRWAAMLLAIAGLLLLTRWALRRYRLVFATLLVWIVGDVLLDRMDAHGWPMAVLAAVGGGALLAGATWAAHRRLLRGPAVADLGGAVYSGVLNVVALLLFTQFDPQNQAAVVPGWQTPVALVVPPLLITAALTLSATTTSDLTPGRAAAVALLAAALGGMVVSADLAVISGGGTLPTGWYGWLVIVGFFSLVMISSGLLISWPMVSWGALVTYPAFLVFVGSCLPWLTFFSYALSVGWLTFILAMTGESAPVNAPTMVPTGLLLGAIYGFAMLWSAVLSQNQHHEPRRTSSLLAQRPPPPRTT